MDITTERPSVKACETTGRNNCLELTVAYCSAAATQWRRNKTATCYDGRAAVIVLFVTRHD